MILLRKLIFFFFHCVALHKRLQSAQQVSPLWIIPTMTSSSHSSNWTVPENWTIFVTPSLETAQHGCPACYQDRPATRALFRSWTGSENLPTNSTVSLTYGRMAASVLAVRNGVVGILVTSDLAALNKTMSRLLLDNQPDGAKGIEYVGERLSQDSHHFLHRPSIGLDNPCRYRIRKRMNPMWTVGLRCQAGVSGTDKMAGSVVLIDERSPPVFASTPKFSISGFSDAFFDFEGIWAMLPSFLHDRNEASVWGLWAQRMTQELGKEMAITSLPCDGVKWSTAPTRPPDRRSQKALTHVNNWRCPMARSFFDCALNLSRSLLQANLVKEEDVKTLELWIKELKAARYAEPRRRQRKTSKSDVFMGCVVHNPARVTSQAVEIESGNHFPSIYPFCKNLPPRTDVVSPFHPNVLARPTKLRDVALVIIFYDSSIYANIQYLQDLYARYFPHLIYCGPEFMKFYKVYRDLMAPLSYIEVPDTKGFVAYECVSRAIMMNYDVSGYLEMADDVILNAWTLGSIPRDRFWFQKDLRTASRHQETMYDFAIDFPVPWWPWTVHGQMWGAKAMARTWQAFDAIQAGNDTKSKEMVGAFLRTLRHNAGSPDRFFYCSSDIFYVPSKFRQSWAMLSDVFFTNNVFLDIAVPTLMNGLDSTGNIIRMDGVYLWYNERGNYPAYYRHYHQFFHPWKMGWIHRSDHANFMCHHVLPHIVKDLKVASRRPGHATQVGANATKREPSVEMGWGMNK